MKNKGKTTSSGLSLCFLDKDKGQTMPLIHAFLFVFIRVFDINVLKI